MQLGVPASRHWVHASRRLICKVRESANVLKLVVEEDSGQEV